MKKFIKKILYRDLQITDFISIPAPGNEKVILKNEKNQIDISSTHWLLCLQPMIYAVWHQTDESFSKNETCTLQFVSPNSRPIAEVTTVIYDQLDLAEGRLIFLKETRCRIDHVNFLESRLLFNKFYKKKEIPYGRFKSLAAAYSFPRKVRLVSHVRDNYYNMFPMDLLGLIPETNKFVFGLRHTNISLKKIIDGGKVLVAEFPFAYKDEVFQLARHHSSSPPPLEELKLKTSKSRHFQFPYPDWCSRYYEIEVMNTKDLGSQMFMLGNIIFKEEFSKDSDALYEIHFLYYLYLQRRGLKSFALQ
jgi:hypothetical protein